MQDANNMLHSVFNGVINHYNKTYITFNTIKRLLQTYLKINDIA